VNHAQQIGHAEATFALSGTRADGRVTVEPITETDIPAVAEFMHVGMSSNRPAAEWQRVMTPPWDVGQPNHGFLLRANGKVVGAYLAMYSERVIDGRLTRFCNLGAWCVAEGHRANGLRMLRTLLRQKGYIFTDLTPNPTVVELNDRLGFARLDTTTALVPNTPWPVRRRGVRVIDRANEIERSLTGNELAIYRDHVSTAAHHAVLAKNGENCYVMYRRDSYKNLPLFATILHVSSPDLFRNCAPHFYRYLLLHRGIPATLAESRVVGHKPAKSVAVPGRTRMYLGEDLAPTQIDYLYSELTCLE